MSKQWVIANLAEIAERRSKGEQWKQIEKEMKYPGNSRSYLTCAYYREAIKSQNYQKRTRISNTIPASVVRMWVRNKMYFYQIELKYGYCYEQVVQALEREGFSIKDLPKKVSNQKVDREKVQKYIDKGLTVRETAIKMDCRLQTMEYIYKEILEKKQTENTNSEINKILRSKW